MTRIVHKMPDGGVISFTIRPKFKARLRWNFITDAQATSLRNIYETGTAIYFLPFPTTSSWDGTAHETIWTNEFNFTYAEDSKTQGQSGDITLEETSNT